MEPDYIGWEAATKALFDGGSTYDSIEAAVVGYVVGESTTGQTALYQLCLWASRSRTYAGALALKFERLAPSALGTKCAFPDCPSPLHPLLVAAERAAPDSKCAVATEHFRKYGGGVEHPAKRAAKNHKHSVNNPYSQFRAGYDEAAYMCNPTSVAQSCARYTRNEAFVHDNKLENQAIELVATGIATDYLDAFAGRSAIEAVGYRMTQRASRDDVGVVELNDYFAANEATRNLLGTWTVRLDDARRFVERGENTYGGKYVVNPSGGPEAKCHPLGATGNALLDHNTAGPGPMQAPGLLDIPDARGKYDLVHNIGLGGAVVINLLRLPEFYHDDGLDGRDRLGYIRAHELRTITRADVDKVRSRSYSEVLLRLAKL
ncbi:hypothetical protein EI94DRAFT_1774353 [Lactarius quietus]|nr:hypothetical protein EI94DRAFT_1774353 [Lactarius quietus]